ncbi:type I-MYXAN CRISPR-associated protein Cas6/Cmx6 [Coleofasciculus sp. FACHB-64]|uniref:type I-MYXAN CRISPR-associated protein Cas6/Cmx6 n=1 Tax=Cyanophyceae TaxID=3028117 RepID=UPI0016863632|nr:type I-MYXAN CRISPR-associated protein Cas6/Cmx6 [Coleofasciculus sp. FACHB-64]MBD2044138.1 type I-MYXAN CRISPR-associated protein Cas6/Cmx6 [Coleofasciculus sp. FACHB-64]
MSQLPYMDLTFNLIGETLPFDHGYELFSAIAHFEPKLHQLDTLGIHTIAGIPKDGVINLTQNSRLRIRIPVNQVRLVYPLAGKSLRIGKHTIRLGIPDIYLLQPAKQLRSRIVVIRGYEEPETFLAVAQRQLEQLGIQAIASILTKANGKPARRTIKIKRFTVVGFGLKVSNLSDEDSLALQIHGVGGKQKMGCGIFVPIKERP